MQLNRDEIRLRLEDLVDNPTTRVPICLVLDTSGSMHGEAIRELNEGARCFFEAILSDEVARYSAEIAMVTFGERVEVALDFMSIERQTVPRLVADGYTPMGEAVNMALDLLEMRKEEYKDNGIAYFQPWMVLMTDGDPTDNIDEAVRRTTNLVNDKKLTLFPIGIGPNANMGILAKFSPQWAPLRLKGLKFKEFFQWLSMSVERTSHSTTGEHIALPPRGGWEYLP